MMLKIDRLFNVIENFIYLSRYHMTYLKMNYIIIPLAIETTLNF